MKEKIKGQNNAIEGDAESLENNPLPEGSEDMASEPTMENELSELKEKYE